MTKHREALSYLVERCIDAHPGCGVRLQGSVARGDERPDSDIDITVLVPAGGLVRENELLFVANRWRMQRVHEPVTDTELDINWVTAPELLEEVAKHGAAAWFMFMKGSTLRDPAGLIGPCETAIVSWFEAHPTILTAWQEQQAAVEAFKRDPSAPLDFPTQPAFLEHLDS